MAGRPRINGYPAIGPIRSLERTAEFYEAKARVIRDAIAVFLEHRAAGKSARSADRLFGAAVAVDRARASAKPAKRPKASGYSSLATVAARRKLSAAFLASFDATTPKPLSAAAHGGDVRFGAPLVRRGYLRKKGAGYVRTAKVFVIDKP